MSEQEIRRELELCEKHRYDHSGQESAYLLGQLDGRVVAERRAPKDSFVGHQMSTPWDELHRAYFNGEALWTYLTLFPYLAPPPTQVCIAKLAV
jgi:hypothetical protein